MCPFNYTAVAGSGKVGPENQVNHTSWVAVVTPADRNKWVRNRCVIELFVALFVLSLCPFDISVGVGAFVIGLSQISSFYSCSKLIILAFVWCSDLFPLLSTFWCVMVIVKLLHLIFLIFPVFPTILYPTYSWCRVLRRLMGKHSNT